MKKNKILTVLLASGCLVACVGGNTSSSNAVFPQTSQLNDAVATSPLCGSISQISPNESGQEYLVGLTLTNISESTAVHMSQEIISFMARTSNAMPIWQRSIHADSDNGIDSLIISGTPDSDGQTTLNLTPEYLGHSDLLPPGASIVYNMKKPIAIDFNYSGQWETPYMFDVDYANITLQANGIPIGIVNASVQFSQLLPSSMTSVVGGAADQKTVTLENSGTSSTLINQVLVNSVTSNLPDSNYLIVNDHCSGFALGAQATCSFDIRLQNVTAIQNLKDYISINYPTGCGSSSDITSNNFIGSVSAAISPTPTPMPTVKPTPTPSPSVAPTPIQKKIVFSSTMYLAGLLGNFSGVNFADNLCQTVGYEITGDATATYKALIVDGKNRVACTSSNCAVNGVKEHKDWVLAPNTKYYDPETGSTPRIQTDSNGLIAIARAYSYSPHSNYNWTGLNADWTTGDTCSHWSVSDSSQKGVAGNPLVNKNSAMYSAVSNNCGTPSGFYCVQQ